MNSTIEIFITAILAAILTAAGVWFILKSYLIWIPRQMVNVRNWDRLVLSSPEAVYCYLEEHKDDEITYQLAEVLVERNDELINLAIARFTKNQAILKNLFKSTNDEAIRYAVLSNPNFPFG